MDWIELYFQIKVWGFFVGMGFIGLWVLMIIFMLLFGSGKRR